MSMQNVYVVSATRTAVGKAPRGTLKDYRPDAMAAAVLVVLVATEGLAAQVADSTASSPTTTESTPKHEPQT